MALEPCRECNKKVSTTAKKCSHCGIEYPTILPEKISELMYSYKNSEISTKEYELFRINPVNIFVRCGKNFCQERYKVLKIAKSKLDKKVCSGCGNKFETVTQKQAKQYFESQNTTSTKQKVDNQYVDLGKKTKSLLKNPSNKMQNIYTIIIIIFVFILLVHYCGDTADGPPRFFNETR